MSLMSHRTTCIRQEWTEEFSVTYLLVGSGNLLRYLFRNTYDEVSVSFVVQQ